MQTETVIICHACHQSFESYDLLSDHIVEKCSRKRTYEAKLHRRSLKWASEYKHRKVLKAQVELKPISDDPDKIKTEYGEENRQNMRLQLSGETIGANCFCPHCKRLSHQNLPVEFLSLEYLWRLNGKPAVLCESCRR
jgi:hypothetical protein